MRVLAVTNMYPTPEQPAFGTFVRDQVEALRQAGIEMDVLFINGRKYHGEMDTETLLDVLDEEADRVAGRQYCGRSTGGARSATTDK